MGGGGGGRVGGCQGGCERRSEAFVKNSNKKWGGEGWVGGRGVRVDVNREVKLFVKIENKNIYFFFWGGGGGGWVGGGGGSVGGSGWMRTEK